MKDHRGGLCLDATELYKVMQQSISDLFPVLYDLGEIEVKDEASGLRELYVVISNNAK